MTEAVPWIGLIALVAAPGSVDDNGSEMIGIEHIINIGRPKLIADDGCLTATDVYVGKVWALLESPFHQVSDTRNDYRTQITVATESVEGNLLHLIYKAIVVYHIGHLNGRIRLIGKTRRSLSATPRLINDIRILEPRHDIVMRTRIGQTVPSKQTTDDNDHGQTQRGHNSCQTPPAANARDYIADMSQTTVDGSEHPANYTVPRPSEPHLTENDTEAVDIVALISDGEVALLGREIYPSVPADCLKIVKLSVSARPKSISFT